MLDYILIVVAGIAMFAQAMMGLLVTTRPPSIQKRIWYEIGFSVVGFLGVSAVVWGGVRTAETSNYIQYGVTHIEQMDIASSTIIKQQSDMVTALKTLLEERFAGEDAFLRGPPIVTEKRLVAKISPLPKTTAATISLPTKDTQWNDVIKKIQERSAKSKALMICTEQISIPISVGLYKLVNQAGTYQNGWAYTRDGALLQHQYETWLGAVREFIAEHKSALPDTTEFEQVKELDMGPTLFVLPSSGVNAWHNFDERRKALEKVEEEFNKIACKAESDASKSDSN